MNSFTNFYKFLWGFHNTVSAEGYANQIKQNRVDLCKEHRMFKMLKYRKCVVCGMKKYYEDKYGQLVLLGTEFGNAFDVSPRVIDALQNADYIICEHEDSFGFLLDTFQFQPKGKIIGYQHFYNEEGKQNREWLYKEIISGKDAVMISDQGMPFIMDPGHDIFTDALDYGVKTTIFPGPDVPATALNISGLNTWDFTFLGSLPHQQRDKENIFKKIQDDNRTTVFFDLDPHIYQTLRILAYTLGEDKKIALCFNITRETENILRGTVKEVLDWLWNNGYDKERENAEWKVQLAVVVEGKNPQGPQI